MMKSPDPFLNRQIDEYRIEALLGRGGMARVYRGVDVHLHRYVAVKVIDTPYQSESEYIKRFEREAQVIAQLSHPNIVQLYRFGETDGFIYMVMQYVEGADLHTLLSGYRKDDEYIEAEEILHISKDILAALDYVHKRGVIHRDVKPSNILLDRDGRAFLSDFGLALLTEIGTMGTTFGSPQYIAPEQALSSAKAEPRSDLYAYGVVLYEMLSGRLPFVAEDPLELAMLHMSEQPPSPREHRPELHPAIEAVLLKALSKDPQDRYETGASLYEALETAFREKAALQEPPKTVSHLTIPDRVRLEVEAHPVKQIPAAADRGGRPPQPEGRPPRVTPPVDSTSGGPAPPRRQAGQPVQKGPRNNTPLLLGAGALGLLLVAVACLCGVVFWGSQSGWFDFLSEEQAGVSPTERFVVTALPQATRTPRVTAESREPSPQATEVVAADGFDIELAMAGEDSLFLINRGAAPMPLDGLQLGNPPGRVMGDEWGTQLLEPGECVTLWKDGGNPQSPEGVSCEQVGERLIRTGPERFWKSDFNVYYEGEFLTTCSGGQASCSFVISAP